LVSLPPPPYLSCQRSRTLVSARLSKY
jgi:hypothetical protein